jgi:DNA-binding response OmpR family regulator
MKARVLVVDDEPDFLQLLEFNLTNQGFDVVTAITGLEALQRARCDGPQVMVLDLMLPDLDGFSVCEILRAQPSTRELPIIILSALDRPRNGSRGAKLNVSDWLKKGVDVAVVGECVSRALAEQQERLKNDLRPSPAMPKGSGRTAFETKR